MAKGFLNRIVYNNWLWILGVLYLVLFVAIHTLVGNQSSVALSSEFPLERLPGLGGMVQTVRGFFSSILFKNAFSLVAILTGGILMQFFSSDNRLIRVRSYFPFFWYCVLGATLFPYVDQPLVYVVGILQVGACFRFFSITEKREMNRVLFDASFLLALGSLAFNRLIWMLPFFWMAAANVQALSFKNIASSLVGFFSLYWLIGGVSYLFDDYRFLLHAWYSISAIKLIDFSVLSPIAVVYLVFMGIMLLISFGSFVQQQNQDKLSTRNNMYAVLIFWLGGLGIWLTTLSSNTALLFLAGIPTLVFYAHFYSIRDSVVVRILFILQLLVSLLTFFFFQ